MFRHICNRANMNHWQLQIIDMHEDYRDPLGAALKRLERMDAPEDYKEFAKKEIYRKFNKETHV